MASATALTAGQGWATPSPWTPTQETDVGTETRIKTTTTTLRLTPEERAAVIAAADAAGLGPSSFARLATLQAAGGPDPDIRRKPSGLRQDIARVLGELGRIGNNVNQVARVANATGDVASIVAVDSVRDQLQELTRAVLELRQ